MPRPAPIPRLIRLLMPIISLMAARYIAYHRRRLVAHATPIPNDLVAPLRGFFPDEVLSETLLVKATMPEPILYPLVRLFGIKGMLEMSSIGGITLVNVVAYPDELDSSTLFHELVQGARAEDFCAALCAGISRGRRVRWNPAGETSLCVGAALRFAAGKNFFGGRGCNPAVRRRIFLANRRNFERP